MSLNPYVHEMVEGWVSDFIDSTRYANLPYAAKECAGQVALTLMVGACQHGDVDPGEVAESHLRRALLEDVSQLALPESARPDVPRLCGAFLEELEVQGRLSGGAELGRYVAALRVAFGDATPGRTRQLENVASKLGRNDPCPCGSGKKYKKCCMGLLG